MKFGYVHNPEEIDISLPMDDARTDAVFQNIKTIHKTKIRIGCPTWSRQGLKNFYPRGTKDELSYYATQFNCIELNATFYRIFSPEQVIKWQKKTPENFVFFTKVPQSISQFKRLQNASHDVDRYLTSIIEFKEKLGMAFLQMHPNFSPNSFDNLKNFIASWPKDVSLALELRHPQWYSDSVVNNELYHLLKDNNITHIITDALGRRDMLHMCLTTSRTFIRYTGANHISDYTRLDQWFERLKFWIDRGLEEVNFFIHQHEEVEMPQLARHLIRRFNNELGYELAEPMLVE